MTVTLRWSWPLEDLDLIIDGSRAHAPPTGPNSFIFVHILAKKCTCRRSTPPNWSMPPMGNPGSATVDDHINTVSWSQQKNFVSNSPKRPFDQSDLDLDPMSLILKLNLAGADPGRPRGLGPPDHQKWGPSTKILQNWGPRMAVLGPKIIFFFSKILASLH